MATKINVDAIIESSIESGKIKSISIEKLPTATSVSSTNATIPTSNAVLNYVTAETTSEKLVSKLGSNPVKRAENDISGNSIVSSYGASLSVNGQSLSLIAKDGTTLKTVTTQDTNTKVTSVGNHYTPTASTTISASGATGTSEKTVQVVSGLKLDAAGHVTGVISDAATDTNTWRPITNTYTGSDQSASVSQYGTNAMYNALLNGYANEAGLAASANTATASTTAKKFEAVKTVKIEGAVTGSATSDFTSGITISVEANHNHDGRYYTEDEIDTKLTALDNAKANTSGTYNNLSVGTAATANYATSAGNADTVDNKHATDFATAGHNHDFSGLTTTAHTHDERYYTETEVDDKLGGKADKTGSFSGLTAGTALNADKLDGNHASAFSLSGHNHNFSALTTTAHTHVKSEITDFAHNHDERYYTEDEIDSQLTTLDNAKANTAGTYSGLSVGTATSAGYATSAGTCTGNANTATQLQTARTIQISGSVVGSASTKLDGAVTITVSTNHTHDERYYTEDEMDNKLGAKADKTGSFSGLTAGTALNADKLDGNDSSAFSLSGHNHNFSALTTTAHTHVKSEITDFAHTHDERYYTEDEIDTKLTTLDNKKANTAGTYSGLSVGTASTAGYATSAGNATTATQLQTARTIQITGSVVGSASTKLDGAVTISTTTNHDHDGRYYTEDEIDTKLTTLDSKKANTAGTYSGLSVGSATTAASASTCTGNAATATKLSSNRTFALTGAVTGSVSSNLDGGFTISTTINHNHDERYYTESEIDTKLTTLDNKKANTAGTYTGLAVGSATTLNNLMACASTATWGTLTSGNGYTHIGHWADSTGGGMSIAAKNQQMSMQLDGKFYQNEGAYRVLDTSDVTDNNITLSWGTKSTVCKLGDTDIHVTMPSNPDTWRPITNTYTGSDQSISVSQYGTNAMYNALLNGYANEAGHAVSSTTCTGNANTATKLEAARTIQISGAVVGSASTKLDGAVTISVTANHSHTVSDLPIQTTISSDNSKIPTGAAVKTYVDGLVSSPVNYKGAITNGTLPTSAKVGDMYIVQTCAITLTTATSATGAAQTAETGDYIIARTTTPTWDVMQKNLNGAVTSQVTLLDDYIVIGKGNGQEVENGPALSTISRTGHTHDDRYYTESEIDTKYSTMNAAKANTAGTYSGLSVGSATTAASASTCTGNAATATKLSSNRTFALTGAVTGSVTCDLETGFTISTTTNHNHDERYYTESEIDTKLTTLDNKKANTAGTYSGLSVGSASNASNADTVDNQHFYYSNSSNTPTYLWGTNESGTNFLASRSSISVNYASGAGNADTCDNFHVSTAQTANTIVARDGSGYIHTNYIESNTTTSENPTIGQVIVTNSSDNYYRKASLSHLKSSLGSMPASDVYSWAKQSAKPSYSYNDGYLTGFGSAAAQDDSVYVHMTGTETVAGKKTFTSEIGVTSNASIVYDSTNECIKFVFN